MEIQIKPSSPASLGKWINAVNLFVVLVIIDFITKVFAITSLLKPYTVFPWFQFQLEKNTGIAFSIAIPQFLLIPLNLIIFLSLIIFLIKKTDSGKPLALFIISLLAAGATGNLIDRFNYGYVIDFISIWNFPVFNLADAYISVSVFLLILFYDKIKRLN
jgi:signal peptidase II